MQRIQLEPGWLLNARPYGDTSLLLEAFTVSQGRVGLIAKGGRGPRSKTRGLLQSLQPLLLSWTQRGELGGLTAVEAAGPATLLKGERLFYAWYLNELVLKLLQRHDPHPDSWRAYVETLRRLEGEHAEFALRVFETRLLADIGYGLPLPAEIDASRCYEYDEGRGFVVGSTGCSGRALLALRDERWEEAADEAVAADLRRLMRGLVRRQLGGRELETPRLLREMRGKLSPIQTAE
ncbi:MAG TPA: DNA repair protein RecO [Solimonas sp.]|nr:DNA repair protein RecO [Solimonas sp.]